MVSDCENNNEVSERRRSCYSAKVNVFTVTLLHAKSNQLVFVKLSCALRMMEERFRVGAVIDEGGGGGLSWGLRSADAFDTFAVLRCRCGSRTEDPKNDE